MIAQVQAICRILSGQDYKFITDNGLTKDMFIGYEKEFDFITSHYEKYHKVPDEITFLDHFENFTMVEVTESDAYIVDTIRELGLYARTAAVFQEAADILKRDSNEAVEFLKSKLETELNPSYSIESKDVIANVEERVQHSIDVRKNKADWFIPTGFSEIDDDINGLQRGDELVVIFARTNMGKSWVAEKIASYIAEIGFSAGYFSPEMNERDIGYRFDTLHKHLSNNAMRLGRFDDDFSVEDYEKYAESLKDLKGRLLVTRPKDFARKVTVSKLRRWIEADKLDALFIDGITYLTDERYKKGDSKTISLTNISEDLMELSGEMRLPVIVVVQANRGGIADKNSLDTPELENIRDSDGIAQNASIVYSVRQVKDKSGDTFLLLDNKKMRGGVVGKSYRYKWNIDIGEFETADDIDVSGDEDAKIKRKTNKNVTGGRKRAEESEDEY